MPDEWTGTSIVACPGCGTEFPPALNACPQCHRLLHGDALKDLAREAEQATQAGDFPAALAAWRSALELLPRDSRQHQAIRERIEALGRQVDAPTTPGSGPSPSTARGGPGSGGGEPPQGWGKAGATGLGALALALWKFKFVTFLVLSKAKFLLLGLTKLSTFSSMFLSIGVYALAWGWKFALGFVVSIYIHEMGHVAALVRYGIRATAPMFIPGVGALIRLQQSLDDPRQEARVALAGPAWGLGAALTSYAIFLATGFAYWAALAKVGAMLNLFNLLPFWQLDGGRAFHALNRPERWLATCAVATMWSVTSDGMIFLIMLVAAFQAAFGTPSRGADRYATLLYAALFAALSALMMIHVPA